MESQFRWLLNRKLDAELALPMTTLSHLKVYYTGKPLGFHSFEAYAYSRYCKIEFGLT